MNYEMGIWINTKSGDEVIKAEMSWSYLHRFLFRRVPLQSGPEAQHCPTNIPSKHRLGHGEWNTSKGQKAAQNPPAQTTFHLPIYPRLTVKSGKFDE